MQLLHPSFLGLDADYRHLLSQLRSEIVNVCSPYDHCGEGDDDNDGDYCIVVHFGQQLVKQEAMFGVMVEWIASIDIDDG